MLQLPGCHQAGVLPVVLDVKVGVARRQRSVQSPRPILGAAAPSTLARQRSGSTTEEESCDVAVSNMSPASPHHSTPEMTARPTASVTAASC
ncbi:unnamed protein product [Merluccius merluccius]